MPCDIIRTVNSVLVDGWSIGQTRREAASLEMVADHIDHICQLAGNHLAVGVGTDLDGGYGREQVPIGVDSIADVQNLAEILARRGYAQEAIHAVFHANWLSWLRRNLPKSAS